MNKRIIIFVCILSLLVPFFPSFDFSLSAMPYVPSESENSWIEDLQLKFQTYLGNNGVVANSDWFNTDYVGGFWNDLLNYMGFAPIQDKDFASSVYDYSVQNNQSADMIFNDSSQFILDTVNSETSYIIRSTVHVSDFLTLLSPIAPGSNTTRANNVYNRLKPIVIGSSSNVYVYTEPWNNRLFISPVLYGIDRDKFVNFSFYVTNNAYLNDRYKVNGNGIVSFGATGSANPGFPSPVSMWVVSGNQIISDLSVLRSTYNTSSGFSSPSHVSVNYNTSPFAVGFANWVYSNISNNGGGSFFIIADSLENFQFPVFLDSASVQSFYDGSSTFYKFDSSVDLGQFANDIDYSRLYDIISREVSHSTGNILNSINNVADSYLKQQLDVLHDINNALNDGNGQSWLRRIYGILDYNFPLTLDAFADLKEALQNISVSGGGSDLTHINRVLDEINAKLGFLIEEPLTDADIQDMESLKNLAQQKFPFCVFSDIVAISVILNRPPVQPHWEIPLKLPGSSSVNNIEVDLSWYEEVRDLVQGVFIFIFIVGLLALSVKIFNALKS